MLVDAGREFLDPLYYRHTEGGAVFGDSLDIDWITKDGVIVATGTNWPAEIQIYVPWGNDAILQGAVAPELLECGTGPWTGGEVRRYAKPHIVLTGAGAYRWQPELDEELVTIARFWIFVGWVSLVIRLLGVLGDVLPVHEHRLRVPQGG